MAVEKLDIDHPYILEFKSIEMLSGIVRCAANAPKRQQRPTSGRLLWNSFDELKVAVRL
jgi:hypothetical protein